MFGLSARNIRIIVTIGVCIELSAEVVGLGLAHANVLGTDTQNFVPTTDGIDFVTVHSSEPLRPGYFNFGLFFNYAANSLPTINGPNSNYGSRLLSSDLNLGVGILNNWDFGISVPSLLSQSLTDPTGNGISFSSTGLTEVRLNTKYRFYHDDHQGFAAVFLTNFGLIQNNPYAGINSGPTFNFEVVYDRKFGPVAASINLGYRLRQPGTPIAGIPILPLKNQLIASVAANYLVESWDTKFIFEIFGAAPGVAITDASGQQEYVLEYLLGAKHDFIHNLAGSLGAGGKLYPGIASPDFRIYAGVSYALGALWGKESHQAPTLEVAQLNRVIQNVISHPKNPEDHFILRNLKFKFNSAELESGQQVKETLDHFVVALNKSSFSKLIIEGHTDSVGNASYNQILSEVRADAIRIQLIKHYKLDSSKISVIGYGQTRPVESNGNYQGRQLNRRVEFKIIR